MYHSNFHTKKIVFDIFNQLKCIPSKALVAHWVHIFTFYFLSTQTFLSLSLEKKEMGVGVGSSIKTASFFF